MRLAAAQHGERGFTLVESLLAAVVLAMTITAVTMPFTAAARNEQDDARRTVAMSLAQELMEEILAHPFADPQGGGGPGPEAGEAARADFDNIDDYDGYAEPAGSIVSGDGQTVSETGAHGLSRSARVTYVFVTGQAPTGPPNFVRVEVEMRHNGQPLLTVTRLVYEM